MLVYEPSKPSSLSSIEVWLKPTASLAVRGLANQSADVLVM
jgi:hypothetical protein